LINNTRFEIPHRQDNVQSYGIFVYNTTTGDNSHNTTITSDTANCGFYGDSNIPFISSLATGVYLNGTHSAINIKGQDFHNLNYGMMITNSYVPGDSISDCVFNNCVRGIYLITGYWSGLISNCSFAQSNPLGAPDTNRMTGIYMINTAPKIVNCQFNNLLDAGIYSELPSYINPIGINANQFNNCHTGIESSQSSMKISNSYFVNNLVGLKCHAGSNLNLMPNAYNHFNNKDMNVQFVNPSPYRAWLQIEAGHNDFYHTYNDSLGMYTADFAFYDNYFQDYELEIINGNKNWYENNTVKVRPDTLSYFIDVDVFDTQPNTMDVSLETNRFFTALQYELNSEFDLAKTLYREILDNPLPEERTYLGSCLDGIYRIALNNNYPVSEYINYFDEKVLQYATTDPFLSKLLQSYLLKELIVAKEFQAAIDLIQPRIDNPISEIDSLRAVLDIEIILQLATFENNRAPLIVRYPQFRYPDVSTFSKNHDENWTKLNSLLNRDDSENYPIPIVATLYQNYPNPFNPCTTISFSIPAASNVRINLYNIKGQLVKSLCDENLERGIHRVVWDGLTNNKKPAGSGIYLIKMTANGKTDVKKAMMLK